MERLAKLAEKAFNWKAKGVATAATFAVALLVYLKVLDTTTAAALALAFLGYIEGNMTVNEKKLEEFEEMEVDEL